MDIERRTQEERQRLTALLFDCGVSEKRMAALESVIENVAWMRSKLDDAREAIKTANVVIAYDNGGGQKGLRENPLFKGYESLFKSYMSGMSKILDALPPEVAKETKQEIEKPRTVLDMVRAKHKA